MMRRVAVINPRNQNVVYKTLEDKDVSRAAGQELTAHMVVQHGETTNYGLFSNGAVPSEIPEYFALNGHLCHGTAVLYAFDSVGQTTNIARREHPKPVWLGPLTEAQSALISGLVAVPASWNTYTHPKKDEA